MRKIRTEAETNRKRKRNQILIGTVMIGLLVFSTLGYSLMSNDKDEEDFAVNEYGIDFFRENGFWKVVLGEDVFGFQNLPSEVSDINVNISLNLGMYSGQPLYFVNPDMGASEVLNNIGRYVLRYQEACLALEDGENGSSCEGDLPTKDCKSNLIIFEGGSETKVYQDENCIYIVGDEIMGADAFLYKLLGIN